MAAATTIEAYLELKDNLTPGLDRASRAVGATAQRAREAQDALANMGAATSQLKMALLSLGAGVGISLGFKQVLDLGQQFEDTALSIAGNIQAFNLAPTFEKSREAAAGALTLIDEMAAKLPGEADQYIQVFKTALPKAIESGLGSVQQVADFTSRYTAVAVSNGIDAMQAGMDLMRMLGGQAGLDVRTWQTINPHLKVTKDLLKIMGPASAGMAEGTTLTAQQFNKLNAQTRRLLIENAIGKFKDSIDAAGDTFSAKMGEMTSRFQQLLRLGSEPIFDAAKDALGKVNEALDKQKATMESLGRVLAGDIKLAMDAGAKVAVGIVNNFSLIYQLAKDIGIALLAWRAAGLVGVQGALQGALTAVSAGTGASTLGAMIGKGFQGFMAIGAAATIGWTIGDAIRTALERTEFWQKTARGFGILMYGETINRGEELDTLEKEYFAKLDKIAATMPKEAFAERLDIMEKMAGTRLYGGMEGIPIASLIGRYRTAQAEALPTADAMAKKGPPTVNFNNNRFDIKQDFAEGFDPDRIAVAFASDLARLGEMKMQSAYAPIGSVR